MSQNTQSLLNSAGKAFLLLLGVNLVAAGIGWITTDALASFAITNGAVQLNGKIWGFSFRSGWGKAILLLGFFWNLRAYYQRGQLSLRKKEMDESN